MEETSQSYCQKNRCDRKLCFRVFLVAQSTPPHYYMTSLSLASLEFTVWTGGREFQMFHKTVKIMSEEYSLSTLLDCNQTSRSLGWPQTYYVVENDL